MQAARLVAKESAPDISFGYTVALSGDTAIITSALGAHVFVRVRPPDVAEHRDVAQAGNCRPPHAGFSIFARKQTQRLAFLWTELVDGGSANAGVGVFPTWLWTELFENTHDTRNACKSQASP